MGTAYSKPAPETTTDWWGKDLRAKIERAHEHVVALAPTVPADAPIEYIQFLALKAAFQDKHAAIFSPPTREIDEFWHNHILDTLAYQESMHAMGGIFIHHNPRGGNDVTEQAARIRRYIFVHEQAFSSDDPNRLMITFRSLTNNAVKLSLRADAIVHDAATLLEQNGYSHNPRIIFNGKNLEAGKKLSEYGVTNGAEIIFVPRLLGC